MTAPPPHGGAPPPGERPPAPQGGPPPPPPGGPPPSGDFSGVRPQADNDKLIGALCYIFWFLVPVIILVTDMKNSRFAKIHAYQGLVFGAAAIAYFILFCVCYVAAGTVSGFLQCILWVGFFVPYAPALYFAFLVYTKEQVVLPGLTDATKAVFKDL